MHPRFYFVLTAGGAEGSFCMINRVVQARLGNRGYNNPHEAGGASAIGKSRLQ